MANFTRVKPLGWALYEKLASALMNQIDINLAKAVNGDDGGSWVGPVKFTDVEILSGGTGQLYGAGRINMSGAIASSKAIAGRKFQPDAVNALTVDNATTTTVNIDLTAFDTHTVNLTDTGGGSPTDAKINALTLTTNTVDSAKEVKAAARLRIIFITDMILGAEVSANMSWPTPFKFRHESDRYLLLSTPDDVAIFELEQVGTPGAPIFDVCVRRARKG